MSELEDLFEGAEEDLKNAPERHRKEAERQADAMDAARDEGWYAFKWRSARQSGVLDVIYMKPFRLLAFVEYKVPGKKATALQASCMKILTLCGFPSTVCYDTDDTLEFLHNVEAGLL